MEMNPEGEVCVCVCESVGISRREKSDVLQRSGLSMLRKPQWKTRQPFRSDVNIAWFHRQGLDKARIRPLLTCCAVTNNGTDIF